MTDWWEAAPLADTPAPTRRPAAAAPAAPAFWEEAPLADAAAAPGARVPRVSIGPIETIAIDGVPELGAEPAGVAYSPEGDYRDVFRDPEADNDGLARIGLRALVGRAPELLARAIELPAVANEAATRALGMTPAESGTPFSAMRGALRSGAEAIRELGFEGDMAAAGYGEPSVDAGQLVEALNPRANANRAAAAEAFGEPGAYAPLTMGERAARVATFIPETLLASAPDMVATLNPAALAAYIGARTNEVASARAENDEREDVTLGDLAIGAPAATVEALLERFTTMRLLPQGTTAATPGALAAVGRIARELGIQGSLGGVEELVPYLAETVGTEAGASGQGALEALVSGAVAEGALGGTVQGGREVLDAVRRPGAAPAAPAPTAPPAAPAGPAAPAAAPGPAPAPVDQELGAELDALLLRNVEPAPPASLPASPAPGKVRLYTGTTTTPDQFEGEQFFSTSPEYAQAYADRGEGGQVYAIDVDEALLEADDELGVPGRNTITLPAEVARGAAPLPKAAPLEELGGQAAPPPAATGTPEELGAALVELGADPEAVAAAVAPMAPETAQNALQAPPAAAAPSARREPAPASPAQDVAPAADSSAPAISPLDLRAEIGWAERGGRMIRGGVDSSTLNADELAGLTDTSSQGAVVGRTPWVGKMAPDGTESNFWRERPVKWSEAEANAALDRFERGEKLTRRQQGFIDYATQTARAYADAEREALAEIQQFDQAEQEAALQEIRTSQAVEIDPADQAEALGLYELARKAAAAGADEIDLEQAGNESNGAYAARLWSIVRGDARGPDTRAAQQDRGEGEGGRADGRLRVAEDRPGARGQPGLFGQPTRREEVDAERRRRDNARDGRSGSGRTDMAAGAGDLFAGRRPEQADLADDTRADLDEELEANGIGVDTMDEARRLWERGYRAFGFHEQAEGEAHPVESFEHLNSLTEDQLLFLPPSGRRVESSRDLFVTTRGDRAAAPAPTPAAPPADLPKRPDFSRTLQRQADNAIDDLLERFGGSVIADTLARDFRYTDTARLVGQVARTPEDLAAMAAVYRNPIFETMHYVFTDDAGNVLGETAVSQRMPGSATIFPSDVEGSREIAWLRSIIPEGATSVWYMHNHPSGDPDPSAADRTVTGDLSEVFGRQLGMRVRGHVVLNHTRFAYLSPDGQEVRMGEVPGASGSDPLRAPRGTNVASWVVSSPDAAAAMGARLFAQTERNSIAFMVTNYRGQVSLATSVPADALNTPKGLALLNILSTRSAGLRVFVIGDTALLERHRGEILRNTRVRQMITDFITVDRDGTARPWRAPLGFTEKSSAVRRRREDEGGQRVFEGDRQTDTPAFRRWFGDSKVVDDNGEPLVVYHGTGSNFEEFANRPGRGAGGQSARHGFFFTSSPGTASEYATESIDFQRVREFERQRRAELRGAWEEAQAIGAAAESGDFTGGMTPNVMPVYLRIENPRIVDFGGRGYEAGRDNLTEEILEAKREGRDGVIFRNFDDAVRSVDPADHFVVFQPQQIKSATGNRGTFDRDDASIVREEPAPYSDGQAEFMRKAGLPTGTRSTLQRARDRLREEWTKLREAVRDGDALKQAIFDNLHGLRAAEARLGLNDPDASPYIAARMTRGLAGMMEGILSFGAPKWDGNTLTYDTETKGLLDALKPVEGKLDRWLGWMVARRAELLRSQGRENLMSEADIAAGLTLAGDDLQQFQQAARDYLKIKNAVLDMAEQAGLIDPQARAAWDHAEYIPFYRAENEGAIGPGTRRGLAGQSSGIRTLRGGETALADPLANIIRNFTRLTDASVKNNATRLAIDRFGAPIFEKAPRKMAPSLIPLDQVRKHLQEQGVLQETLDTMPSGALKGVQRMLSIEPPTGDDVVRVMRDGRPEYYQVSDPLVLRALTAFKEPQKNLAIKPLIWFKRLLTQGITTTADFVAANFLRDSGSAWVMSDDRFTPGWDSIKGVVNTLRNDRTAREMMMAGGTFMGGNFYGGDPDAAAAALRRALRAKGMQQRDIEGFMGTVARSPLHVWDAWMRLSSGVENSNRRAVYDAAIKAGRTKTEAAFMARDLMDFSMQGDAAFIQFFADVLPFFNARLQGLYKLGRRAATKEGKRAIALRGGVLTLASMGLYAWNMAMYAAAYDDLEEWDKDAYWHIAPGTDWHVRIPKPFEIGIAFGTIPERIAEAIRYGNTGREGDTPTETWQALVRAITGTLAINPIPQAFLPIVEQWGNKRFFTGRPIENMGDDKLLPEAREEWFTSDTMKAIADVLPQRGPAALSAKRLQHLWEGYTGGMGAYVLDAADWVTRQLQDAPTRPEAALRDFPLVGRFARGGSPAPSKAVGQFYDMLGRAEEIEGTIKDYIVRSAGDTPQSADLGDRALELQREHAQLLGPIYYSNRLKAGIGFRHVQQMRKVRTRLSNLRQEAEDVALSTQLSAAEKREQLDEITRQRNTITREFLEKMRTAEVEPPPPLGGGAPGGVRRASLPESRRAEYVGVGSGGRATPAPEVMKGARNKPRMVMVGDWSTIESAGVREAFDRGAAGAFDPDTGTVYVAMGLDEAEAKFVAYHEVAGHYGLRGALGERYEDVLNRARENPTVRALADAMRDRAGYGQNRIMLTEEALSELAAARHTEDYDRLEEDWGVSVPPAARSGLRGALSRVVQMTKRTLADLTGEEPRAYDDDQVWSLIEDASEHVDDGVKAARQ